LQIKAAKQLNPGWGLMKMLPTEQYRDYAVWLKEKLGESKKVGFDPLLLPLSIFDIHFKIQKNVLRI